MDETTIRDTLALHHLPGMYPALFHRLLQVFGSPSEALQANTLNQFVATKKSQSKTSSANEFLRRSGYEKADKGLCWQNGKERTIITLYDSLYPFLLKEIPDPPAALYVIGNPALLSLPQIAIVGSRNSSPGGKKNAANFATALARYGLIVTSGLAYGVDSYSHQAALDANGKTIAVLGAGVDRVYPKSNKALYEEIICEGALVSEFALGDDPLAWHFPMRNRIISGLSNGVLVVEAALKSGSLITARMALEQGREVFAVPGSIHNHRARGCHKLIREGACLIESAEDVVAELQQLSLVFGVPSQEKLFKQKTSDLKKTLSTSETELLQHLDVDPVTLDTLALQLNKAVEEISSDLLDLELQGLVQQQEGGYILAGSS